MIRFIRYFFYVATNWNIPIALRIIRSEITGERKYGINSTGADELKDLDEKGIDTTHATIYMPVSYELLEDIFEQLPKERVHFLDIGCGRGRALCVAAHKGFMKATGIDFSRKLCDAAEKNCSITKMRFPSFQYAITNNDAFYYEIPQDVDVIFLFNPFDEVIMCGVARNVMKSLSKNKRKVHIVYVNPLHKELFIANGFTEIYQYKKMKYLEVSIMSN